MIHIGIDPGKKTGYAECADGEIIRVLTTTFSNVFALVSKYNESEIVIHIEVTTTKAAFGGEMSHTRSVNIGMVYRESHLLADHLDFYGYSVKRYTPKQKGKKWDAAALERITGYAKRTNEHQRDAIQLCWGRR
jgi:hypothetical protein